MLVLGATSDEKGAQLEALVRTVLRRQDFVRVRSNVVGAGGNELDLDADRESVVVGGTQITPLMGEAKAYADSVNMPTWQKFLGKLFIERARNSTTIGILIALNGINGNVAGSFKSLRVHDSSLFVFEGGDLEKMAREAGELAADADVILAAETQFQRVPQRVETAYYAGAYYWVVWWNHEQEYSVVGPRGEMMPTEDVERLRPALENSLPGVLLATEEANAEAQARHDERLILFGRLFRSLEVSTAEDAEMAEGVAALAQEPYCRAIDGRLELVPARELSDESVARLFLSIFENAVKVRRLSFMIERHHSPYVDRLVDAIPGLNAGFSLDETEAQSLRSMAPLFPSVWATLASGNSFITTHRTEGEETTDEGILATDRTAFWESIVAAIRSDFSNQRLQGFLYDYMGVTELEARNQIVIKDKDGPVGAPIETETRDAVRQFQDDSVDQASDPVYVMIRMLPNVAQPWDEEHPEPAFSLDEL